MKADISLFESLQPIQYRPISSVAVFNLNQSRAIRLLDELSAEVNGYIVMIQTAPNAFFNYYEKFDRDFNATFTAVMDYASSEDSGEAQELTAKAIEVKNKLDQYRKTIRKQDGQSEQ